MYKASAYLNRALKLQCKACRLASSSDFSFWHLARSNDTALRKRSSGGKMPVLSTETMHVRLNENRNIQMKWSRTLPNLTFSLNSSCLSTSRLTVSSLGLITSARLFPSPSLTTRATPFGKHLTNFSASWFNIGDNISIVGRRRYVAVAEPLAWTKKLVERTYRRELGMVLTNAHDCVHLYIKFLGSDLMVM